MNTRDLPELVLASGGRPSIDLRLPPNSSPAIEYAAEEFRRCLCAMVGAKPCVRVGRTKVFVGHTDAASAAGIQIAAQSLGSEAFRVEGRDGNLYIVGGGPRGVLYGVYDVLERLGCRWYTPQTEFLPRLDEIRLPVDPRLGQPAFEYRDNFNWETADPVWRARNRLNGWQPAIPDYLGGHNDYGMWCHTFFPLVSIDEHFDRHPEYFSMIGGVRRRDANQLCLSNPDVVDLLTARLLERIDANPRARIFSVSQNDGMGFCECPACMALAEAEGAQSGPILHFVNAVAGRVAARHPHILIDTLAYLYSVDPPRHVRPAPNVRVRLCAFGCCQAHGLGTCEQDESRRFLKALNGWSKITSQLYIWHYCTNFAHYVLPMPNLEEIHADLQLYQRSGVHGVFLQGQGDEGGGAELSGLRGWLAGRLLWSPRQSLWPLVDEFLRAEYGAAAPVVRRYVDVFHGAVARDRVLHFSLGESPSSLLYARPRLQMADKALEGGEARVTGPQRQRVAHLRAGLGYARLHQAVPVFRVEGNRYFSETARADRQLMRRLEKVWRRSKLEFISEGSRLDDRLPLWRNRMSNHRVEWLREGDSAVAVTPDLGGRLLEFHAAGRQWLAGPMAESFDYPCPDGYSEVAGYMVGSTEPYACRRTAGGLRLRAVTQNGLGLERWISLKLGVLRIRSRLWNPAKPGSPVADYSWGAGFRVQLDGLACARVSIQDQRQVITADRIPDAGTLAFEGPRLPPGHWEMDFGGMGILHHRFGGPAIYRAALSRLVPRQALLLYLCSNLLHLAPGQEIRVWQELSVVAR